MLSESIVEMFGGYADVAPYYYDSNFNPGPLQNEKIDLPEEYHPVWRMPDPWNKDSQCKEDFILIAEFSEIEGPKPLITIPKSVDGEFDLNEFSVRIMSVDSQSQPGDSFRVHNDTSVVMSEARHNVYAYVHNLTLYDSKARGFVRPFCIAYVTADNGKLQHFHEAIQESISKVTQILKEGNLAVFVKDMTYHLTDLQYTQERFLEKKLFENLVPEKCVKHNADKSTSEDDLILQSLTEDSLQTALKEVKHILHTVNSLLTDFEGDYDHDLHVSTETTRPQSSQEQFHYKPALPKEIQNGETTISCSYEYSCSFIDNADIGGTRDRTRRRSNSFSGDLSKGYSSHCDGNDVEHYQPKLVRTTNKRRYDKTLRTLHELCLSSARKGIHKLRFVQKYFSKDLPTLKLEKRDGEVLNPQKSLMTFGGNVQLNFAQEQKSGMKSSKSTHSDLFSDETASYASAESFLSCEDLSQPAVILHSSIEDLTWMTRSILNSSATTNTDDSLVTISIDESGNTEASDIHVINEIENLPGSLTDSIISSQSSTDTSHRLSNMVAGDDFLSSVGLSEGSSDLGLMLKVFCLADRLQNFGSNTPGHGLLKFVETHSFSQHVLFTLLCGRPLVVVAKTGKEESIRSLLITLSFFLTNAMELSAVTTLHHAQLTTTDLSKKLIGVLRTSKVPKDKLIPKHLEQLCSVLDLERRVYYGPCYLGGMLTEVYSRRKVHTTDTTYLAYIHVILQELSMKAYVFYHTFIENVAAKLPHMYAKPEEARVAYRKAEQHFLSRMKVSAHDTEIIKYLAEVMHKKIYGEFVDLSGISTSTLDTIPCQVFKQ